MAKVVDITDKLDFEGNPKIRIKKEEYEINADASTILKIMGILGKGTDVGPDEMLKMYELMFNEKERKRIEKLQLNFNDFRLLVESSISIIAGESNRGE